MQFELLEKQIIVDRKTIEVSYTVSSSSEADIVRILIPVKVENEETLRVVSTCIKAIQMFTQNYELWLIDNSDNKGYIEKISHEFDVNIIINHTKVSEGGSYENALALELATRIIPPSTQYIVTFHQDTCVCTSNWLEYLLSKINEQVKIAGFREDKVRVPQGVLHVLGYLVDFQLFKKLNLSFFPDLPKYDVGDKVTVRLIEEGYQKFATPNSMWEKDVIGQIKDVKFREVDFDRSIDENGNVLFMHLGRGVLKSIKPTDFDNKKSISTWVTFIEEAVFGNKL